MSPASDTNESRTLFLEVSRSVRPTNRFATVLMEATGGRFTPTVYGLGQEPGLIVGFQKDAFTCEGKVGRRRENGGEPEVR